MGYRPAAQLTTHDSIVAAGHAQPWVSIESIQISSCPVTHVYDLEVKPHHNFVVLSQASQALGLVVHNCHHISSEMFSQALPKIACRYTLGLSATPKRKDGLSYVFYQYLGELYHAEKRQGSNQVLVKRLKLTSSASAYETLYMGNGTKNTGAMITNLAKYLPRTHLIIECIRVLMQQDRKILVLSGRREHLDQIHECLGQAQIVTIHGRPLTFGYYRGNQGMNKKEHKKMLRESAACDVVLGTIAIASEGLDIPDLNTEILATPAGADVEQPVGRILRKYHTTINPIVVDLVDQCGNFPKHAKQRANFYQDEDYEIQDLKIPLGHTVQELQPFLQEIQEYLFDTEFKQTRFKFNDEERQAYQPLGQCMLDDDSPSTVPITHPAKAAPKTTTTTTVAPSTSTTPLKVKTTGRLRAVGVTGGKNANLGLGICVLDDS